jgi:dTDP-4-amino-4,6-dideoxygalactose transaminase
MTTGGEGGMLFNNDEEIWKRAWSFKDHGQSMDALVPNPHPWIFRWLHDSFGISWRMTEMQAAIGRVALRKIPSGWKSGVETPGYFHGFLKMYLPCGFLNLLKELGIPNLNFIHF